MTDEQAMHFLNDWPDGTRKSFGTDFTAHWDGQPSMFGLDRTNKPTASGMSVAQSVSKGRETAEATGSKFGRVKGTTKDVAALHVYGVAKP